MLFYFEALEKLQMEQVQPATESIARTFNELRSDIGLLFDLKVGSALFNFFFHNR